MKSTTVLGSPGVGKTFDLVNRVNEVVSKDVNPSEVQVISHTKTASNEIKSRLDSNKGIKANTIHSICYGLGGVIQAQVVTRTTMMEFSKLSGIPLKLGNIDTDASIEVGDEYLSIYELARNSMSDLMTVYENGHRPGTMNEFKYFVESYEKYKKSFGFIDFTDMLMNVVNIDGMNPNIKYLFIDEAQDLSVLQWAVVDKLIHSGVKEVTITGDPDQSLYEWGGADPRGMQKFHKKYDSEIINLKQSYRVPKAVHVLGQKIINRVDNRTQKEYFPTGHQGSVMWHSYPDSLNLNPDEDTLILYRCHALRKNIEDYLIENYIPYETLGGMPGIMQNKYAKAIKAILSIKETKMASVSNINTINNIATNRLKKALSNKDIAKVIEIGWERGLLIPVHLYNFFDNVDMSSSPKIKLSTIHGSKGMEADHVILDTSMTWRTRETMEVRPNPEHRVWFVGATRSKKKLSILDGEMAYDIS